MKIAFLTNILTPYRMEFYDVLEGILKEKGNDLRVYAMTDSLPLRPWTYRDLKRDYTELLRGFKVFFNGVDYLFNPCAAKHIITFNPDVLIIAGSWTYPTVMQLIYSPKIKKTSKRLLWTESHNNTGINNRSKTNTIIRLIKSRIVNRFDGFCLPGKYALETLSAYCNIEKKAIIKLPNLVNCSFYKEANLLRERKSILREERQISKDSFVFFTPARFVDLKGLVPFFSKLQTEVCKNRAVFILAGSGPEKELIEEIVRQKGLDVRLYDYQSKEQVREWLALSDAFLLPSLSDAYPLSSIEAAWAGLPLCLSCYVGNGPELVEDSINGVIFDTLDEASVNTKIAFVLNQSETWKRKAGAISLEHANERFDLYKETRTFADSVETSINT